LTGVNRDLWAEAREHLLSSGSYKNSHSLSEIEKAAFVIVLDQNKPQTSTESAELMVDFSRSLWHGDGHNRFFDKPCQWVIFENGESGIIGEHSTMDGSPTARMNNDMTLALMHGNLPQDPTLPSASKCKPKLLEFDIDSKTENYISQAMKEFQQAVHENQMHYLLYQKYGKTDIKAQKTSPDAW